MFIKETPNAGTGTADVNVIAKRKCSAVDELAAAAQLLIARSSGRRMLDA
jgi:hypothetical protein